MYLKALCNNIKYIFQTKYAFTLAVSCWLLTVQTEATSVDDSCCKQQYKRTFLWIKKSLHQIRWQSNTDWHLPVTWLLLSVSAAAAVCPLWGLSGHPPCPTAVCNRITAQQQWRIDSCMSHRDALVGSWDVMSCRFITLVVMSQGNACWRGWTVELCFLAQHKQNTFVCQGLLLKEVLKIPIRSKKKKNKGLNSRDKWNKKEASLFSEHQERVKGLYNLKKQWNKHPTVRLPHLSAPPGVPSGGSSHSATYTHKHKPISLLGWTVGNLLGVE